MSLNIAKYPAYIFARGGSKGIPKKNIKEIAGLPLIGHTIKTALESDYISDVIVSTDCDEIAAIARDLGAQTPFKRPKELAEDTSSEVESWRHAIQQGLSSGLLQESDPFICLPATSPLRKVKDINNAIKKYQSSSNIDLILGICESRRNPYLNMVKKLDSEQIKLVNESKAIRRQDVPEVFDITTVIYVGSIHYLMNCTRIIEGNIGYVDIPPWRAIDIDDQYDFYLAELMLNNPFQEHKERQARE